MFRVFNTDVSNARRPGNHLKRRYFFRQFLGAIGLAATGASTGDAAPKKVLIQDSPIAGFQFHHGETVWESLRVGSRLELRREADNPHDPNAVALYFQGVQLGYVPRGENTTLAQMLDRGQRLAASVSGLKKSDDPWQRIRVTIELA